MGVEELGMLSPMLVFTDQMCNYVIDLDEPVDASAIRAEEEEALIESAPMHDPRPPHLHRHLPTSENPSTLFHPNIPTALAIYLRGLASLQGFHTSVISPSQNCTGRTSKSIQLCAMNGE
jgi:hypothetical protein